MKWGDTVSSPKIHSSHFLHSHSFIKITKQGTGWGNVELVCFTVDITRGSPNTSLTMVTQPNRLPDVSPRLLTASLKPQPPRVTAVFPQSSLTLMVTAFTCSRKTSCTHVCNLWLYDTMWKRGNGNNENLHSTKIQINSVDALTQYRYLTSDVTNT